MTEGYIGFNRTLYDGPTDPWWEWLVKWSVQADSRWAISNSWDGGLSVDNTFMFWVVFQGSRSDAEATPLYEELRALWEAVPVEARLDQKAVWGFLPRGTAGELLTEFATFAEYKLAMMIPSAPLSGDMSDRTAFGFYQGNRLIPRSFFVEQPQEAVQLLKRLESRMCPFGILYHLGGHMAEVDPDINSVNPNLRNAVYQLGICSAELWEEMCELFPNDVGGTGINHAGYHHDDPNWAEATWGNKYPALLATKATYDPGNLFHTCRRCVGWNSAT